MDPLHPIPQIQPAPLPAPPNPARVQRIAREQDRDSPPGRERPPEDDADDRGDEEAATYDPNWGNWRADTAPDEDKVEPPASAGSGWSAEVHDDRRAAYGTSGNPDDDERPGPHIDITA